jgi:AraC family transcriptional regulator of adaptative response/methylated-DNA-[protein]-cysteine methyltransferase
MSSMAHSPELDAWIRAFESHIADTAPRPELPLELRGTAFQVRVWKFLLGVPEGGVVSYGEGSPLESARLKPCAQRPRLAPLIGLLFLCLVIGCCGATVDSVAIDGVSIESAR